MELSTVERTKIQCSFCSLFVKNIYICPRCKLFYCSKRCYRDKQHENCSEEFYRECVEDELKLMRNDSANSRLPLSFEEFMKKANDQETSDCLDSLKFSL